MSNDVLTTKRTNPPKSPLVAGLIQAAVLAIFLVPLGSVALEASVISTKSCSFYYFGGGEDGCGTGTSSSTRTFDFDFGTFTLELFNMTQTTSITVTEATLTQSEFASYNAIAAANCVPIADGTGGCRMLEINASNPAAFTGWRQDTFWNTDTNLTYPNGVDPDGSGPQPGQIRVYRSEGTLDQTGALVGQFTEDMCLAAIGNSSYTPCEYFPAPSVIDPGIRSGNTDFSVLAVVQVPATVPEPSSLLLLGTGALGLFVRKGRRSKV